MGTTPRPPSTHVVYFVGQYPFTENRIPIESIRHRSDKIPLCVGVIADHMFSNKPAEGYRSYYDKLMTYTRIIASPAIAKYKLVGPTTDRVHTFAEDNSFEYHDTASSACEITSVSEKLRGLRVGIVGLGGTGAYVLDHVAKTSVFEIRIIDADVILQKNAFRMPGAITFEEICERPAKVIYYKRIYDKIHKRILAHQDYLDASNLNILEDLDYVFICIDRSTSRREIIEWLISKEIPFVDVGIGLLKVDEQICGSIRTTTSDISPQNRLLDGTIIPTMENGDNDPYTSEIQIAELNSLNAALAVISWKKHFGYYVSIGVQKHFQYTVETNVLSSLEEPEASSAD